MKQGLTMFYSYRLLISTEVSPRFAGPSGLPVFCRRRAGFLPGFCKVFSISRLVPARK